MAGLVDVSALVQVCAVAAGAGIGMVLLFSVGVLGLDMAAGERAGTGVARRVWGRLLATLALTACAALVVLGVAVMLRS